jgi:DNA repair exonuclease SbcCD ATPase subunit
MTNESNDHSESGPPPVQTRTPVFLYGALALAVIAIVILAINAHQVSLNMSALEETVQAQNAKLNDQLAETTEASNKRLDAVAEQARETAAAAEDHARSEVRKTSASLSAKLADERRTEEQVAGDLDQLKQASSDADSKLTEISADVSSVKGDVSSVKGDIASTQTQVDDHGSALKRVTGDMGVMSGLIATNADQLKELRTLGERDYIEFDLKKGRGMQKVGKLQLGLDKADPKRSRFTFDVLADDKRVQKRDRTINEPIQLYVSGSRQPCEIVVNEVKKDEVVGYLAVPKVLVATR